MFKKEPNIEVLIYGKLELMIMKHCPIRMTNGNEKCTLCDKNKYYLDDKKNHKFRLLKDSFHKIRIMDYQNIDKISDINELKNIGVTNFRIDLLEETNEDISIILNTLKNEGLL